METELKLNKESRKEVAQIKKKSLSYSYHKITFSLKTIFYYPNN